MINTLESGQPPVGCLVRSPRQSQLFVCYDRVEDISAGVTQLHPGEQTTTRTIWGLGIYWTSELLLRFSPSIQSATGRGCPARVVFYFYLYLFFFCLHVQERTLTESWSRHPGALSADEWSWIKIKFLADESVTWFFFTNQSKSHDTQFLCDTIGEDGQATPLWHMAYGFGRTLSIDLVFRSGAPGLCSDLFATALNLFHWHGADRYGFDSSSMVLRTRNWTHGNMFYLQQPPNCSAYNALVRGSFVMYREVEKMVPRICSYKPDIVNLSAKQCFVNVEG